LKFVRTTTIKPYYLTEAHPMPVPWASKSLGQDGMKWKNIRIYNICSVLSLSLSLSLYGINASRLLGTGMGGKLSFLG